MKAIKQRLISTVLIVIGWSLLDFLFHGIILMSEYQATQALWRPMAEMNNMVMHATTIITALIFVLIYCKLVQNKSLARGIKLGVLVGLLTGVLAASSYAYMPITTKIAGVWFLAHMAHYLFAGLVVGKLVTCEMDT